MTIQLEQATISGSDDFPIGIDIRFDNSINSKRPAIVICHGFKGFKDWGFFPPLAEFLAQQGFMAVTFNFSHNGHRPHSLDCTELDNFKNNLPSKELYDLNCVFQFLKSSQFSLSKFLDPTKISVAGHSRGGGIAVCFTAQEPSVYSLITLASVASYHIFSKEIEDNWRKEKVLFIENSRTGQQLPLGVELLEEIVSSPDIILEHASKIPCPTLIVHGEADPTVSLDAAHLLHEKIVKSQLSILSGAGHTFDVSHPFKENSGAFADLKEQLLSFLLSSN